MASLDAAPRWVLGDVRLRDLQMKRYLTLMVLVLASLPVFAAVDMVELESSYDMGSIVMVMMGAIALVATRKLQHH